MPKLRSKCRICGHSINRMPSFAPDGWEITSVFNPAKLLEWVPQICTHCLCLAVQYGQSVSDRNNPTRLSENDRVAYSISKVISGYIEFKESPGRRSLWEFRFHPEDVDPAGRYEFCVKMLWYILSRHAPGSLREFSQSFDTDAELYRFSSVYRRYRKLLGIKGALCKDGCGEPIRSQLRECGSWADECVDYVGQVLERSHGFNLYYTSVNFWNPRWLNRSLGRALTVYERTPRGLRLAQYKQSKRVPPAFNTWAWDHYIEVEERIINPPPPPPEPKYTMPQNRCVICEEPTWGMTCSREHSLEHKKRLRADHYQRNKVSVAERVRTRRAIARNKGAVLTRLDVEDAFEEVAF